MEKQFLSKLKKQVTELARKQVFISKIMSRNIRVLGNLEALRDLRSLSLKDIGKGLDFTYIYRFAVSIGYSNRNDCK